jgi:hypothetical protein
MERNAMVRVINKCMAIDSRQTTLKRDVITAAGDSGSEEC